MRHQTYSVFLFVPLFVFFAFGGAGCTEETDQAAETVVQGAIGTPLSALQKAEELTDEQRARQNRQSEEASNYVTAAFILIEGNDRPENPEVQYGEVIGCQDTVAFLPVSRASDSGQVVTDALASLFAVRKTTIGGLYNSLAFSKLKVAKAPYTTNGKTTVIELEGTIETGGTCDDPRAKAQIEETIRRFHPDFNIILNGSESAWRCFGDMSGLCE